MARDWNELTRMTGGKKLLVERVRVPEVEVVIEGVFELPPLACLQTEDQIFVAEFVRCHGSIKQMEQAFGVSYPTIKGRLNRISELLGFLAPSPMHDKKEVLERLDRGEISAQEALEMLKP